MAYMNRSEALDILDREKRTKTTPNTKTDLKELNEELDRIHNQGYAVIDEELQMGILGTACPVFDRNGELAAAIAFTSMKDGDTEKMFQRTTFRSIFSASLRIGICAACVSALPFTTPVAIAQILYVYG